LCRESVGIHLDFCQDVKVVVFDISAARHAPVLPSASTL
jgi:hypothetical protein